MTSPLPRPLRIAATALVALTVLLCCAAASTASVNPTSVRGDVPRPTSRWSWPTPGPRIVVEAFRAPAHAYGAGHRGVDISVSTGADVRAPADGVVAFRGVVVDRPLLTIDTLDGWVVTLEPMESELNPGDLVEAGTPVGLLAGGGHSPSGSLHVGVRWRGAYVNPMLLFEEVPRAILLPCCAPL